MELTVNNLRNRLALGEYHPEHKGLLVATVKLAEAELGRLRRFYEGGLLSYREYVMKRDKVLNTNLLES